MRRSVAFALLTCVGFGCAAPRASGPALSPQPAAAASVLPPAADALPSFPLVKDDPAISAATNRLDSAVGAQRPAQLLARAKAAVAAGQRIRAEQGGPVTIGSWAPDYQKFLASYDLAYRDLEELLAGHPTAPEAPEASYLMGLIHDFRHLDNFEEALSRYHRTVALYPGTPWAGKAGERIKFLEGIMAGSADSPHGDGPPQNPAR